ncbi:glycine cleavage system transcriptional activator GcvA (plasmid) [Sinorhizobium americanum CCGM7]|nr:glycine cleavage system transcriptional activator GcvA [Sinorhizobium americanum CCGM7]
MVYATSAQRLRESGCDVLITLGADTSDGILGTKLFSRVNKPVASHRYIESKATSRMTPYSARARSRDAIALAHRLIDGQPIA